MNGYWCLFIFKNLKKKSHLIFIECVFCECVSIWLEIRKLLSKFFDLLFPQQLTCREALNPHQIMRGWGSPQSSLGRQSHRLCSSDPNVSAVLFPPPCCQPLGQWLSKATSSWFSSAQYKLLVDDTSPLVPIQPLIQWTDSLCSV